MIAVLFLLQSLAGVGNDMTLRQAMRSRRLVGEEQVEEAGGDSRAHETRKP